MQCGFHVCVPLGAPDPLAPLDSVITVHESDEISLSDQQHTPGSIWKQWTTQHVASDDHTRVCLLRENGQHVTPDSLGHTSCRGAIFVGMQTDRIILLVDLIRLSSVHRVLPPYEQRFARVREFVHVCGTTHVDVRLGTPQPHIR